MRVPIEQEVSGKAPDTNDLVLETEFIKAKGKICIQRISATNETTSTKSVTFGLKTGSGIRWLISKVLTTAGLYYSLVEPVYVTGNVQVVFKFNSPSANDYVRGFVFGYYED